jgi:hypothetical protein
MTKPRYASASVRRGGEAAAAQLRLHYFPNLNSYKLALMLTLCGQI